MNCYYIIGVRMDNRVGTQQSFKKLYKNGLNKGLLGFA